jgi:hypothetical protein
MRRPAHPLQSFAEVFVPDLEAVVIGERVVVAVNNAYQISTRATAGVMRPLYILTAELVQLDVSAGLGYAARGVSISGEKKSKLSGYRYISDIISPQLVMHCPMFRANTKSKELVSYVNSLSASSISNWQFAGIH